MKHTKGPWTYVSNTTGLYTQSPAQVLADGQPIVDEVHGFGNSQQEACDQATANAALMAAAPELLEALKVLLEVAGRIPPEVWVKHSDDRCPCDMAREAIAKAIAGSGERSDKTTGGAK